MGKAFIITHGTLMRYMIDDDNVLLQCFSLKFFSLIISPASKMPSSEVQWSYLGIFLGLLTSSPPHSTKMYIRYKLLYIIFVVRTEISTLKNIIIWQLKININKLLQQSLKLLYALHIWLEWGNAYILKREEQNILLRELLIK